MPVPTVTLLYAGLFGLMTVVLGVFPGRLRGKTKISIGDGGNPELLLAMRRHGNFVENVPMALILMALLEMNGAGAAGLHGLGTALLAARIAHAVGLKADTIQGIGRAAGAGGTALVLVVASIWCLVLFL